MSDAVRARRLRLARGLAAGAVAWSIGLLLTAVLAPAYNDQTISNGNGLTLTSRTFVQVNGTWVLIPLAVPLLASLASLGLLLASPHLPVRWAWIPVVAVLALALVAILTIGPLLLPVAILLALALRVAPPTSAGADPASAPLYSQTGNGVRR